jgi:hypothetical protein
MPVDGAILDEAVRRFPRVIWSVHQALLDGDDAWLHGRTVDMIRREYRLILAERAKGERMAA